MDIQITDTEVRAIRPLTLDKYPIDYAEGSMNLYVREGEETASLAITDKPRDYEPDEEDDATTGIDMVLNEDELFYAAMAFGEALGALRTRAARANLAELIKGLTDVLFED